MADEPDYPAVAELRRRLVLAINLTTQGHPTLRDNPGRLDAVIAAAISLALDDIGPETGDLTGALLTDPESIAESDWLRGLKEEARRAKGSRR